jgi:hypothetical protein
MASRKPPYRSVASDFRERFRLARLPVLQVAETGKTREHERPGRGLRGRGAAEPSSDRERRRPRRGLSPSSGDLHGPWPQRDLKGLLPVLAVLKVQQRHVPERLGEIELRPFGLEDKHLECERGRRLAGSQRRDEFG